MEAGDKVAVLELFSGIGGMHTAMRETGYPFQIVGSYEINPMALLAYQHNFGTMKNSERNIMGIDVKTFEDLTPDVLLMSPPCQPFTRQGLKKDIEDARCSPLLHILCLLGEAKVLPRVILLENVAGFESSLAHLQLLSVLTNRGYIYQEFLLTPSQLGIPNSRLRYYMVARLDPCPFSFDTSKEILAAFPVCTCYHSGAVSMAEEKCGNCSKTIHAGVARHVRSKFSRWHNAHLHPDVLSLDTLGLTLSSFLDALYHPEPYLVQKKILLKYAFVFDIVDSSSSRSCCFTRGYGYYAQGTGSVVQHNRDADMHQVFRSLELTDSTDPQYERLLSSLGLRYFTPREVMRLMCFPEEFAFPPSFSLRQIYKMLGNSVNILVVTILLTLALEEG